MANEVFYNPQTSKIIPGELKSMNGYYNGHPLGTPTQDALFNVPNGSEEQIMLARIVDLQTKHIGTIMQDAADEDFPQVGESPLTV